MHKGLANFFLFQLTISEAILSWFSQLDEWKEARKLRKASRNRAEVMSELARILCDLGETSRRVRQLDTNPYGLLIDGVMNRGSSEFDPRQYWDS